MIKCLAKNGFFIRLETLWRPRSTPDYQSSVRRRIEMSVLSPGWPDEFVKESQKL
jgi:hypothetical protein